MSGTFYWVVSILKSRDYSDREPLVKLYCTYPHNPFENEDTKLQMITNRVVRKYGQWGLSGQSFH